MFDANILKIIPILSSQYILWRISKSIKYIFSVHDAVYQIHSHKNGFLRDWSMVNFALLTEICCSNTRTQYIHTYLWVGFAISMFKGPQYQQRPWGHNIKHVHGVTISNKCIWSQYQCHWYCDPMSHPQTLPNLTIDIMHPWTIDIVHMLLVQGFAISMPLILWPHVQIQNLAKIVPLILWPHGTLILWLV